MNDDLAMKNVLARLKVDETRFLISVDSDDTKLLGITLFLWSVLILIDYPTMIIHWAGKTDLFIWMHNFVVCCDNMSFHVFSLSLKFSN